MKLAISVVSHRQTELIEQLLSDLVICQNALSCIVLTLNTIDEPTPSGWNLLDLPNKIILRNEAPLGFGANHNRAIAAINGDYDYVFVLNPDLRIPDPNIFMELAARAHRSGVEYFAPRVFEDGKIAPNARGLYTPWQAFLGFTMGQRANVAQPAWLAGMFIGLSRRAWEQVSGFDEKFFMYCEDVDLGLRLGEAGFHPVLFDEWSVQHFVQRASHRNGSALVKHLRSALRLWLSKPFWRRLFTRAGET